MTTWPQGIGRRVYDTLDSTNAEASRLGAQGADPTWVFAKTQDAGRGRRGRAWVAAPGNFTASLLIWPERPIAEYALNSFVAALAVHDVLAAQLDHGRLGLKWPNDVLLDGKKASGILLETVRHKSATGLIIGIGINLKSAPSPNAIEPRAVPPTSLADAGIHLAPEDCLDALAPAFEQRASVFKDTGFAPIRDAWLVRATGLGLPLTARLPTVTHRGVFETINDRGALVLKTDAGSLELDAAEVYGGSD